MKIAIPLDEDKISVCPSFGRAPFFFFQDSEKGTGEIRENPAAESQGGAGTKAAQFLLDERTEALITVRCGQNAADVFRAAGVLIFKAEGAGAEENLAALREGRLEKLNHFHAGFHGVR
ncbi:MAG: NifB/NifX family molybdenum-iron cluster-binding protein [Firmicutes bacterium]|nr:NifB/NifX family molybdenum-iron cluster-binding protein [Bacillota bacterium]